jgi:DNA/RNA-binding domain of Phe-tRNA-synthetase-like protein
MVMFGYQDAILAEFPTIRAGLVHARALVNGPSPAALGAEYESEQRAVTERLATIPIAELPSIAAWRRVFARFGAKPTQYRSAAEALLRRLAKHGDIPPINLLVDIGNLVSIRYAMPVAVVDLAFVTGAITVQFATGDEQFTDLGSSASAHPQPGEVIFADEAGQVSARRWCWRQSARSATTDSTVDALFIVEGQHNEAAADVQAATRDIVALLGRYQQGSLVDLPTIHTVARCGLSQDGKG